jgi:hypothetical protein
MSGMPSRLELCRIVAFQHDEKGCNKLRLISSPKAVTRIRPTGAIGALGASISHQSYLLAYSDCFLILGCVLLASAVALFFMKKTIISGPTGGH